MARSQTSRFSLWRWSSDSDTQARSDFDSDNNQIESLALIGLRGTLAARPAAGVRERLYYATDVRALYWDNGSTWKRTPGSLVQSGSASYSISAGTAASVTVSFPVEFTAAPIVVATVVTTSFHRAYAYISGAPSTTGATIRVQQGENSSDTLSGTVHWMAHGQVD